MEPQTMIGYDMLGQEIFPDDKIFWNRIVTTYREYMQSIEENVFLERCSLLLVDKEPTIITHNVKSESDLTDLFGEKIEIGDFYTRGEYYPFIYMINSINFLPGNTLVKFNCTCFLTTNTPHNTTELIHFNQGIPILVKVDPTLAQQFILKSEF